MSKLVRRSGRSGYYINVPVPLSLRKELRKGSVYRKAGETYREAKANAPRLELEILESFQRETPAKELAALNRGLADLPVKDEGKGWRDDDEADLVVDQATALNIAYQAQGATEKDLHEVSSLIVGNDTYEVWIEKRQRAEDTAMSTVTVWRSNLKRLAEFVGTDYLQSTTQQDALRFKEYLLTKMQPQSCKKVLSNIKGFWTWAKANKQVTENIWDGLTRRLAKSQKKKLPVDPVIKAADLKARTKHDHRYSIMRWTGCRSNEASGLRHCDIDMENRTITFEEYTYEKMVRRLKKREADERVVPISNALYEDLKSLELDDSERPLWPTSYKVGNQSWGQSWCSDFKKKYHDNKPGFTSHDLRRWIATKLALNNVSPYIIYEITRWTTPGMSEVVSVYTRPSLEQLREVMEMFELV